MINDNKFKDLDIKQEEIKSNQEKIKLLEDNLHTIQENFNVEVMEFIKNDETIQSIRAKAIKLNDLSKKIKGFNSITENEIKAVAKFFSSKLKLKVGEYQEVNFEIDETNEACRYLSPKFYFSYKGFYSKRRGNVKRTILEPYSFNSRYSYFKDKNCRENLLKLFNDYDKKEIKILIDFLVFVSDSDDVEIDVDSKIFKEFEDKQLNDIFKDGWNDNLEEQIVRIDNIKVRNHHLEINYSISKDNQNYKESDVDGFEDLDCFDLKKLKVVEPIKDDLILAFDSQIKKFENVLKENSKEKDAVIKLLSPILVTMEI